jgi:hypothetical protein
MKKTRFMEVMFSNTDEELAKQVDNDIKSAKENGVVDTEEVEYRNVGDGNVAITDKENGEVTLAQEAADEADTYDLVAVPDGQLEKFVHPSADGVHPGNQVGAPDEKVENHVNGGVINPEAEDGGLNPEAGNERLVEDLAKQGPCMDGDCDEKEFSVFTDNQAVLRIFSDQEYCERLFSEVIESEETAKVGDLKIEKLPDEDNTVVVTNETTGDQAKVTMDDDEMEVEELDRNVETRNYSDFMPLFVVGVQPFDHIIVDAQEYSEESAEELKAQLEEDGVQSVEIFDNQEDARTYAIQLLNSLGANPACGQGEVEEPVEEREYSEYVGAPVFTTRYYSDDNEMMCRMFSEASAGIAHTQDLVEEAIHSGDPVEFDGGVITPIDAQNAIISDVNGDHTLASVQGVDMQLEKMDAEDAQAVLGGEDLIEVESDNDDDFEGEEEREYSDIYSNEAETKFFSDSEPMTAYMERLFSEEADQDDVEKALESDDVVETENEIITPISDDVAVIEDKTNGEFSKAIIDDEEDTMDVTPLTEDEAEALMDEADDDDDDEEQKEYSDIYSDEAETKFFSEDEPMTEFMVRLFSEEDGESQCPVEAAIESGEQIETEGEIITPISDDTAVVEDKGNGEFTKVVAVDDETMNVHPLSDDEAENLIGDEDEKQFSDVYTNEAETKFFSEHEPMTSYMERLFSEEADQDDVEKALESGDTVETDNEVITPISDTVAVVEDKNEDGEFTKAIINEDGETMDVTPLTEDEAETLIEEAEKADEHEKKFSTLDKFFAEAVVPATAPVAAPVQAPVAVDPNAVAADPNAQVVDPNAQVADPNAVPTVENIEDKALAAVESIKAAAAEASAQIMEAKAAPAPDAEPEIVEAQFSEKTFSENDTLVSWLSNK